MIAIRKWSRCVWHTQEPLFWPLTCLCSFILLDFRGGAIIAPPPYRSFHFSIPTDTGLRRSTNLPFSRIIFPSTQKGENWSRKLYIVQWAITRYEQSPHPNIGTFEYCQNLHSIIVLLVTWWKHLQEAWKSQAQPELNFGDLCLALPFPVYISNKML